MGKEKYNRINEAIKAPKVRLIDENGNQVGIVDRIEALLKAEDAGLDLVEMSVSDIPVCKIIDYGKYKYDKVKKLQKSKKTQEAQEVKGIRLSVKIGQHDFDTKLKTAKKFIEKGNKLSLQLRFKGREMAHRELGKDVLERFVEGLGEVNVEQQPKFMGRAVTMVVAPGKANKGN